jgi:imidazole glycerol-phosphate synthase subunit HisH
VADGRPVLGVCVGMQIFFDSGVEHGVETKGLGLLPGVVSKLSARRIPHMGWNTVDIPDKSELFRGLDAGSRFYFVHSYAASDLDVLRKAGAEVTTASHDEPFAAAVELGPLSVAQFHPEKSADAGFALLRNWVAGL